MSTNQDTNLTFQKILPTKTENGSCDIRPMDDEESTDDVSSNDDNEDFSKSLPIFNASRIIKNLSQLHPISQKCRRSVKYNSKSTMSEVSATTPTGTKKAKATQEEDDVGSWTSRDVDYDSLIAVTNQDYDFENDSKKMCVLETISTMEATKEAADFNKMTEIIDMTAYNTDDDDDDDDAKQEDSDSDIECVRVVSPPWAANANDATCVQDCQPMAEFFLLV